MATSHGGEGGRGGGGRGGGGDEDRQLEQLAELRKTLKEGERIVAPTRRPDGTFRKPIRIRAGYVPPEEVAIYQSKGALWKKEMAAQIEPPGYDPSLDAKPKTKSVKKNDRKKEKRLQAALEKEKNLEASTAEDARKQEAQSINKSGDTSESVKSLTSEMNELAVSGNSSDITLPSDTVERLEPVSGQDIDKRIRALKKKIRQTEALKQKTPVQDMKPEQLDKLAKLEDWHKELKLLEEKRAETTAS